MSVKASYVSFLSCNVSSATSRRILLGGSGVLVGLGTVIPLNNAQDSSNATGFYNKLIVKLTAAVNSGNFTKLLQQVSAELGATSMKNATISTITSTLVDIQYPPTFKPTSNPTVVPTSSRNPQTTRLSIVVIALVGFFMLIVISYCCVFIAKRGKHKIIPTTDSDD
jgi:hypothetical protein